MTDGSGYIPYNILDIIPETPIKTESFCLVFDTENAIFHSYSWMYFGQISLDADKYSAPAFTTGQLVMYDKSSFNNLILQ